MSFLHFIRLIIKNLKWLILIPSALAFTIFYFTRNEKKVYSSESIIYTGLASGYSLSGSIKADFFATSNAFDNLISVIDSRETKEDVAIQLLSEHLFYSAKKHDESKMKWPAYDELQKLFPAKLRESLIKADVAATREAVKKEMSKSEDNEIYKLINSDNHYYSIEALNKGKATRISNSDLIKISYETNDPFICKRTIELLEETFMLKHLELKEGQTQSAVQYFELETKKAFAKLDSAERLFLAFNKDNDIINYYEQTKAVAGEREDLYAMNHNLEMDKMASSSSLAKVNENIKGQTYQALYGSDVIKEREKLSDIYNKIAFSEALSKKGDNRSQTDSLKIVASRLEKKLKSSLENLYVESNTPNGIPTKTVLDEWLKTTLAFEQSKARLTVMDKRKAEFQEEYRKFAPLGAMLKKIERLIAVSEQEYLELLHDLNLAKLNQQNTELSARLKIVDPPYLPLKANASKRVVLVAVGFVVGFVLILALIITQALINKTLMEPQRAKNIVGIPLLGVYPLLNENPSFLEKSNLRLMQKLLSTTDLSVKPITIGLISTQKSEGKSTIAYLLAKELSDLDYTVETHTWNNDYDFAESFHSDFSLIEFPALEGLIIKPETFPRLNTTILLCRANRIWSKIDKEMLSIFSKTTGNKPLFILNGVDINFAEEYIGEVPKKRNLIRAFLKRVIKFEFGNRRAISNSNTKKKTLGYREVTPPPSKSKFNINSVILSGIITALLLCMVAVYMYRNQGQGAKEALVLQPEQKYISKSADSMPKAQAWNSVSPQNSSMPNKADFRFYVIAGTFSTVENAQKYLKELKEKGFAKAQIVTQQTGIKNVKVAYDCFNSEIEADKASKELNIKYGKKSWVYTRK
jgi:polysaccharide biosynthesis transport protein